MGDMQISRMFILIVDAMVVCDAVVRVFTHHNE